MRLLLLLVAAGLAASRSRGCGAGLQRDASRTSLSGDAAGADPSAPRDSRPHQRPRRRIHRRRSRRPHLPAQIMRGADVIWIDVDAHTGQIVGRTGRWPSARIRRWHSGAAPLLCRAAQEARREERMRVLIVEDEPNLGRQLRATLEGAGYAVDLATDGEDGHYLGSTETYDAIILDLGLPEVDGLTVLDRWRKEGIKVPVLVLTARDSWSDKVAGLDAGADDYLAKPFQTEELIARLRALIRRASGNASSELTAGDVRLDTRSGKVTLDGEPVKLTAQEYKLLSYLMHHKGKVVSRTELIEHIYDQDFDRDSNTIEVFVTRIRKKLGPDVITTIRGLGYSLEDPTA